MKKNIIIKISIPILVLVGIIAIVFKTIKPIEEQEFQYIEQHDFVSYVDRYVADSIEGKSIRRARYGYEKIYDIIETEDSIEAYIAGSIKKEQLLADKDAKECYRKAFKTYFSIFAKNANTCFQSSVWNENELNQIKLESQNLRGRIGVLKSQSDSLKRYERYVNGYYSALKLIRRSQNYRDNRWADGNPAKYYRGLCEEAERYESYPFKNCTDLSSIVSDVKQYARESWKKHIENYVEEICDINPPAFYNSYDDFYSVMTTAYRKIQEYNGEFKTSWGEELKEKLEQKDEKVSDYHKRNKETSEYYSF